MLGIGHFIAQRLLEDSWNEAEPLVLTRADDPILTPLIVELTGNVLFAALLRVRCSLNGTCGFICLHLFKRL